VRALVTQPNDLSDPIEHARVPRSRNISPEQFEPIYRQLLASEIIDVCEMDGQVAGFCKAIRHEGRSHHVALVGPLAVRTDAKAEESPAC